MPAIPKIITLVYIGVLLFSGNAAAKTLQPDDLYSLPDMATTKVLIDTLVDPSIDIKSTLAELESLSDDVQKMYSPSASDFEKYQALRKYLYEPGEWNNNNPFHYDLNDPLGTNVESKLISTYLKTRKGNCVSMPILFLIIGEKIGLDLTLSTAPLHIFIRFKDKDTDKVYNIETTSGGHPARTEWIVKNFPLTKESVANGVYLKSLSRKEVVSVMLSVVIDFYMETQQYNQASGAGQLSIKHYPTYAYAMVKIGSAYYRERKAFSDKKGRRLNTHRDQDHYESLSRMNHYWFNRAESLGWVPSDNQSTLVKSPNTKPRNG